MRVAAVDMGATSVRVAVIDLEAQTPQVEVVHRWFHGPETRPDGSVRWCWRELLDNVRLGLARARELGPLSSIGVDGWAVDYGLLDENEKLLSDPHSYRSHRTANWRDVVDTLGESELYRRTGIQLMPINTIFQLAAHDREELADARHLVMLPELVAHELTGVLAAERSNAGTTGFLDLATDDWATDLCAAVGVDSAILLPPEKAGRILGEYLGTPVCLVAAHDTACAFAASPLATAGRAFVSAGTWFLVGIERGSPDVSDEARRANFSNERGALAGYRFLKNVPAFWLLEQCARQWGTNVLDVLELAARASSDAPHFDVTDERFLSPINMVDEVRHAAGLPESAPPGVIARSVVESVALGVASIVEELRATQPVEEIVIVGGGAASTFVRERIASLATVRIVTGHTEATALGNALIQGIALNRFRDLGEARAWAIPSQSHTSSE